MYWRDIWGNTLSESDTSGNMQNDYIYFAGKRIAYVTSSGSQYYYLTDQIGSVRKIADASGTLCYDADYTPYGDAVILMNTCAAQPYLFAGMERDEDQLDYDFARFYSWRQGRFMSADPLGGDTDNPQSLNRYTYVLNDPINLTDPSGMKQPACDFLYISMQKVGCPWSYGVYWFSDWLWGTPNWVEGYPYNSWTFSDWGYTGGSGTGDLPDCNNLSLDQPGTFWNDTFASSDQVDNFFQSTNSPSNWDGYDLGEAFTADGINPGLGVGIIGAETSFCNNGCSAANIANPFSSAASTATNFSGSLAGGLSTIMNLENHTSTDSMPLSALINGQNDLPTSVPGVGQSYTTTQQGAWYNNVQSGFRKLGKFVGKCY